MADEEISAQEPLQELPEETSEELWYRSEMLKLVGKLIDDKLAEEKLKNFPLWGVVSKSLKLTFLDERDASVLENLFEAEVCRYLRSLPPNKQNFETYTQLGQARMLFYVNLRRSIGTPVQKINERIAILSQWKITSTPETQIPSKPGILKRIFG